MKSTLFFCLLTLLLCTGCETLYVANPVNMPLISQAGEFQGQLSVGSSGYSGSAVIAPAKHLALMANASTYRVEYDSIREPRFRSGYGEVGIGYWTRLEKYVRLEAFTGMGWGITGEFPRRDNYNRFFFQPNIGLSTPSFDTGFSPRLSVVTHTETRGATNASLLPNTTPFFEPSMMFRAGYRELKFQVQLSRSIPLSESNFGFQKWAFSFGAHLTLGKDFDRYGQ